MVKFYDSNTCEQIFEKKSLNIFVNIQNTCEFIQKTLAAVQKNLLKQANKL